MIMSRPRPSEGYEKPAAYGVRRFKPVSGRRLLATWAVLSSVWAIGVGYEVFHEVNVQADMSRDVERDLDNISPASCTEPACSAANRQAPEDEKSQNENWSNIASTYIKFGSVDMAESALGPPLLILAAGAGWILFVRRRRRSTQLYRHIDN